MRQRLGRYHLVRHLAQGGMGDVWLADAPGAAGFSKTVVVKTLLGSLASDERFIKGFVAEGRLLLELDHPNIAQVLDLDCVDEQWLIAMEFVDGFNLRELLAARSSSEPVDEVVALCVMVALARALDHAGTRVNAKGQPLGLVHHDVSPSNVMIRRDGLIKLVDFGVARARLGPQQVGQTLRGKVPYLAPEHHQNPDALDSRVDLFALGLMSLELLSGHRALDVSHVDALPGAWAELSAKVRSLQCTEATAELIGELLALNPQDRPPSAANVLDRIQQRLVALEVADYERPVVQTFAQAFESLDRSRSGFDQTLSDGLFDAAPAGPATASLPGLSQLGSEPLAASDAPALLEVPSEAEIRSVSPESSSGLSTASPRASRLRWVVVLVLGMVFLFREAAMDPSQPEPLSPPTRQPITTSGSTASPTSPTPEQPPVATQIEDPAESAVAAPSKVMALPVTAATQAPPASEQPLRRARAEVRGLKARSGSLVFRVLPADAKVLIDDAKIPHRDGIYRVRLKPGVHRVTVIDPSSGHKVQRKERVFAGQAKKIPGFVLPGVL
ncbi:MAG: hypothetical protein CMH53_02755 [Myxococcales bacterium]|nr:hypothetical protein [Myxococcales bacterium]